MKDGEPLASPLYGDIYFSAQGGLAEKRHVFVAGNGLPARWRGRPRFAICETGFGTGLSFLAAGCAFAESAAPEQRLDYVGIEKHPLEIETLRRTLAPWREDLSPLMEAFLDSYPLRTPGFHRILFETQAGPRLTLTLLLGDVNALLPELDAPAGIDAWFLDGFTPAKNPDMWTPDLFAQMRRLSAPRATFATFTAAGAVRRGLEEAGFTVEKRKGFGYKHDMLAGALR